jgi:hypothetical protein
VGAEKWNLTAMFKLYQTDAFSRHLLSVDQQSFCPSGAQILNFPTRSHFCSVAITVHATASPITHLQLSQAFQQRVHNLSQHVHGANLADASPYAQVTVSRHRRSQAFQRRYLCVTVSTLRMQCHQHDAHPHASPLSHIVNALTGIPTSLSSVIAPL